MTPPSGGLPARYSSSRPAAAAAPEADHDNFPVRAAVGGAPGWFASSSSASLNRAGGRLPQAPAGQYRDGTRATQAEAGPLRSVNSFPAWPDQDVSGLRPQDSVIGQRNRSATSADGRRDRFRQWVSPGCSQPLAHGDGSGRGAVVVRFSFLTLAAKKSQSTQRRSRPWAGWVAACSSSVSRPASACGRGTCPPWRRAGLRHAGDQPGRTARSHVPDPALSGRRRQYNLAGDLDVGGKADAGERCS
jgi:hypothetical protein